MENKSDKLSILAVAPSGEGGAPGTPTHPPPKIKKEREKEERMSSRDPVEILSFLHLHRQEPPSDNQPPPPCVLKH